MSTEELLDRITKAMYVWRMARPAVHRTDGMGKSARKRAEAALTEIEAVLDEWREDKNQQWADLR